MTGIGAKNPRYGPRLLGGWERFQAWRNARKSAVATFADSASTASASLSSALNAQTEGLAIIAAQIAIKRIAGEAAAKVQKAQATLDKLA